MIFDRCPSHIQPTLTSLSSVSLICLPIDRTLLCYRVQPVMQDLANYNIAGRQIEHATVTSGSSSLWDMHPCYHIKQGSYSVVKQGLESTGTLLFHYGNRILCPQLLASMSTHTSNAHTYCYIIISYVLEFFCSHGDKDYNIIPM